MTRDECVELEIDTPVKRATDKAILVSIEGEDVWIPQSQIHDDSEVYGEGHTGKLIVSEWVAKQKGLV